MKAVEKENKTVVKGFREDGRKKGDGRSGVKDDSQEQMKKAPEEGFAMSSRIR